MTDLKVDYESLETSLRTVGMLRNEFDHLPETVRDRSSDWGNHDIQSAMHEFAGNWDYRRDLLSGTLKEVGEKLEGVIEAFKDTDETLATELDKAMHGDGATK